MPPPPLPLHERHSTRHPSSIDPPSTVATRCPTVRSSHTAQARPSCPCPSSVHAHGPYSPARTARRRTMYSGRRYSFATVDGGRQSRWLSEPQPGHGRGARGGFTLPALAHAATAPSCRASGAGVSGPAALARPICRTAPECQPLGTPHGQDTLSTVPPTSRTPGQQQTTVRPVRRSRASRRTAPSAFPDTPACSPFRRQDDACRA
jgi:hypothetical protein